MCNDHVLNKKSGYLSLQQGYSFSFVCFLFHVISDSATPSCPALPAVFIHLVYWPNCLDVGPSLLPPPTELTGLFGRWTFPVAYSYWADVPVWTLDLPCCLLLLDLFATRIDYLVWPLLGINTVSSPELFLLRAIGFSSVIWWNLTLLMITQNIQIATGPHDTHKFKHAINGRRVKQPNKPNLPGKLVE